MKTFEIYIQDLVPEKQKELIDILGGENGNYDVFPISVTEFEDIVSVIPEEMTEKLASADFDGDEVNLIINGKKENNA